MSAKTSTPQGASGFQYEPDPCGLRIKTRSCWVETIPEGGGLDIGTHVHVIHGTFKGWTGFIASIGFFDDDWDGETVIIQDNPIT